MDETAGQDDVARLLGFLRDRDVPCPVCRYNLRDLPRPECPECRHDLRLTVGVTRPRFLWFLLAVTPCTFSAVAAGLMLIPMLAQPLTGGGGPEPLIVVLDAMGWLSAIGGLVLIRHRFTFLRQTPTRQRVLAAGVWALHVLAFVVFWATALILQGGP